MDWIAVGLRLDVPAGTAVPRRVQGIDLAIWCSEAGVFHAWGDRCPHRGMRLSHGFVRGETLACIYHGWQYDDAGACAYIPAHPDLTPPKTICAQTYGCAERDGVIWVALHPVDTPPPPAPDRRPVRSLDVALPAAEVARRLNTTVSSLLVLGGAHDLAIGLQPSTDDTCVLHALAAPDQDRKQVSRHLEQIRADLEEAT